MIYTDNNDHCGNNWEVHGSSFPHIRLTVSTFLGFFNIQKLKSKDLY